MYSKKCANMSKHNNVTNNNFLFVIWHEVKKADQLFKKLSCNGVPEFSTKDAKHFQNFGQKMPNSLKMQMNSHFGLFDLYRQACAARNLDAQV